MRPPSEKQTKKQKDWNMVEVTELLVKALNSIPNTNKMNKQIKALV
jgi:hypothetical protein